MSKEFSIVIPCKNESKYIERLFRSIQRQTVFSEDSQIIVADDESCDGTCSILERWKNSQSLNIQLVKGGYPAVARNNGARIAQGKYIIFLDADVELGEADFLEKSIELANQKDLYCVSSYIRCPNGNIADYIFWKIHGISLNLYKIFGPFSAGMFMLVQRNYFESQNGFDENLILGEDFELSHLVPKEKFGIVPSYINITNRRFQQDGYLSTIYKYTRIAMSKKYRYQDHKSYFAESHKTEIY